MKQTRVLLLIKLFKFAFLITMLFSLSFEPHLTVFGHDLEMSDIFGLDRSALFTFLQFLIDIYHIRTEFSFLSTSL